jgi:hypothetical protein
MSGLLAAVEESTTALPEVEVVAVDLGWYYLQYRGPKGTVARYEVAHLGRKLLLGALKEKVGALPLPGAKPLGWAQQAAPPERWRKGSAR